MKSKLKKLMAAAAVSFAFSAPASAAIGVGDSATLFLSVFDPVSQASYVRDLGVSLNNFGTQFRPTGGFTTLLDDQASDAFTSTTDSVWTSFVAVTSGLANLKWDVVAIDGNGGTAADARRVLFTSLSNAETIQAGPGVWTNNAMALTAAGVVPLHVAGANVLLGAGTAAFTTNPTDAGNYGQFKFNNLAGGMPAAFGNTWADLGQSMGFYYGTRSSSSTSAEAVLREYKLSSGEAFQWTLDSAGNLSYGVTVAAIPEPTTWALFAAGALMLGGMARRRLS